MIMIVITIVMHQAFNYSVIIWNKGVSGITVRNRFRVIYHNFAMKSLGHILYYS